MKIRKPADDDQVKAAALLRQAFPHSTYVAQLFEKLHAGKKVVHEWVCIHRHTVTGYIAYTHAYDGEAVCGLHLGPLAVQPQMQNQGIGSELLRFSLRQTGIRESSIFVLGDPGFYQKFGFQPCLQPSSPFATKKAHFLSLRNVSSHVYIVGYEREFKACK